MNRVYSQTMVKLYTVVIRWRVGKASHMFAIIHGCNIIVANNAFRATDCPLQMDSKSSIARRRKFVRGTCKGGRV